MFSFSFLKLFSLHFFFNLDFVCVSECVYEPVIQLYCLITHDGIQTFSQYKVLLRLPLAVFITRQHSEGISSNGSHKMIM